VLTPTYGAPEQVTGESVTTLADVYSLGVVLFELLTGALPFSAKLGATPSLAAILDALRHEPVPAMTQVELLAGAPRHRAHMIAADLRAELRGDLDAIVQKALRKSPRDRYASVERLASDLRCFLGGMPIDARPPSIWYSLRLLVRRQRNAVIAGTVGVLVTFAAVILIVRQHYETREQEARVGAVRNFMFELVNDVEPDESSQSGLVTAKQMLDGAAYRARRDFAGQPRLLGELIGELGRMYSRVGESDIARNSLIEAVGILETRAPRQDPFLNKMRANLADEFVETNDFTRARELAEAALRDCSLPDKECKKALAYAESVLSEVHLASGEVADALAAMQRSVSHYVSGFGPRDAETALANVRLATIARNAGQVLVAKQAIDTAVALTNQLTLSKSDRYQVHLISAIIEFDLGQYARAYDGLTRLLVDPTTAMQRQTILRLMANAQVARGDMNLAMQHVLAAIEIGGPPTNVQALFARETLARIKSVQGEHEQAHTEIEKVIAQLTASGRQSDAPEMLRAQRTIAEIHLRARRFTDAHSLLTKQIAVAAHNDLELALATELLGNLYQAQGNSADALNAHRVAHAHLQKSLPANHPFLLRNTLYIAAASNDRAAVQEMAEALSKVYAENSIWQSIIDRQYLLQAGSAVTPTDRLLVL